MSCYAYKEDTRSALWISSTARWSRWSGRCRLSTHLCFGNFKGHAVGYRRIAPMLPDFLDFKVDEVHVEMASREFAEIELIAQFAQRMEVAVGIVDVKSYYIETVEDIVHRIKQCLEHVAADKLSVAPDCGLSQTARWAARRRSSMNMVEGARQRTRDYITVTLILLLKVAVALIDRHDDVVLVRFLNKPVF